MAEKAEELDPKSRAEDILLGSLGFGEDAKIFSLKRTKTGYAGVVIWPDGEKVEFAYEDELDDLQKWALELLAS